MDPIIHVQYVHMYTTHIYIIHVPDVMVHVHVTYMYSKLHTCVHVFYRLP
jgi:hypothetical protein